MRKLYALTAIALMAASGAALAHGAPDDAVVRTPPPRVDLPEKAKKPAPPPGRNDRAATLIGVAAVIGVGWLIYADRRESRETAAQVDATPDGAVARVTWRF